jgi:hypothetical protein
MQGNPRQAKPAKSLLNIAAQIRKVSVTAGEVLYVPPFWSYTMLTEPTGLAWGMDILSPSAEQLNLLEAELQQLPFPPRVSNLTHVVSDDYEYEQLKTILQKHEAGEIEGEGEGEGEGRSKLSSQDVKAVKRRLHAIHQWYTYDIEKRRRHRIIGIL